MATHNRITTMLLQEDHRVNGVSSIACNEAVDYLQAAHGVLAFITGSVCEVGGVIDKLSINPQITYAALNAAEMLMQLGIWQMQRDAAA